MGWTFFHKPKGQKAIDTIRRQFGEDWWNANVVAASATFEAVHIVVRSADHWQGKVYVPDTDGMIRAIGVIAIKSVPKDHYNFGYKDMAETMGPVGRECAASIIAAASPLLPKPPDGEDWNPLRSAHEYRERSLAFAKAKALKRTVKVGAKIKLEKPLSFSGVELDEFIVVALPRPRPQGTRHRIRVGQDARAL